VRSAAVLEADVCAGEVVGVVSRLGGELAVPDRGERFLEARALLWIWRAVAASSVGGFDMLMDRPGWVERWYWKLRTGMLLLGDSVDE